MPDGAEPNDTKQVKMTFFENRLSSCKPSETILRLLCLGDVMGRPGRDALRAHLSRLKERYGIDLIMANGENSAGCLGITPATVKELEKSGVDVITTGNHVWRYKECYPLLVKHATLLRPANYPEKAPGKGVAVVTMSSGVKIAFINLLGRVFMESVDCPFATVDRLLSLLPADVSMIIVDMHAEATSEKRALFHYLDGRVSAVVGTHTHVQTADASVSRNGTASITDLGMCGVEDSVLGMDQKSVIARFTSGMPHAFRPARGSASLNGVIIDIDTLTGKALDIALVRPDPAKAVSL